MFVLTDKADGVLFYSSSSTSNSCSSCTCTSSRSMVVCLFWQTVLMVSYRVASIDFPSVDPSNEEQQRSSLGIVTCNCIWVLSRAGVFFCNRFVNFHQANVSESDISYGGHSNLFVSYCIVMRLIINLSFLIKTGKTARFLREQICELPPQVILQNLTSALEITHVAL